MATYKPLQSIVLTAATSSVTFSGIDQSYTDLVLVANIIGTVDSSNIRLTFNGDSSALYSPTWLAGSGSSAISGRDSNQTSILLSNGPLGSGSSTSPVTLTASIPSYTNTNVYKTVLNRYGTANATYSGTIAQVSLYRSFSAISSLTLTAQSTTFAAGTTLDLYGIKSGAPQALGGDLVTTDGNYWYHTFRSTQTFTPLRDLTCDYLVVAGGGGAGGNRGSGGGGAGGYRAANSQSFIAKSYVIEVGAGGSGFETNSRGTSGANSVFGSITSIGGGGGGGDTAGQSPLTGGSGGGGNYATSSGAGAAGTSGQGNAGGTGSGAGINYAGGGGGGASAAGSNGVPSGSEAGSTGGAGGAGTANSISGSSVTYAGGGGGSGWGTASVVGTGGAGGGGNSGGGGTGNGSNGTANRGGGGGGGAAGKGGNGGSGIVIVRYPV